MVSRFVLLVIVAVAAVAAMHTTAAQDDAPPVAPGRFAGKVAVIYMQGAMPEDAILIRDAKLERVHDRWFLTGVSPDLGDPEDWMSDTPCGVDWARVETYNLLTEEQFQDRVVNAEDGRVRPL